MVLDVLNWFYAWSGKNYLTIFREILKKPMFIEDLKIKWCTSFKLLDIHFHITSSNMQIKYEKAVDSVIKEINSLKYRFLTIFGKITVVKTMCLPKLNHIVAVVPNPNLIYLKQFEVEFKRFINENNPSIVDETTRYMPQNMVGLE